MTTPLISIIIPTYNRASLIKETLNSIIGQTFTNWECIIIDDGSTDDTEAVISDYVGKDSRFRFYKRPEDRKKGPNSCRNFGFEVSKGSWINWFDSDDIFVTNALEDFIVHIDSNLDAVVAKLMKVDSVTKEVVGYNRIFSENLLEKYYTGFISFYVCGPLWNKVFLDKQKELFDEKIRFLDDWDFNLRMLYQKPKIKFIDKILIQYNIDSDSLSNQIYKLNTIEINSEIYAREKQLKIVKENQLIDYLTCLQFTRERYKIVLRDCLTNNQRHQDKNKLIIKILKKDMEMKNAKSFFKTILGYLSFSIFNKGYVFFK